jgi:hypothetical protein
MSATTIASQKRVQKHQRSIEASAATIGFWAALLTSALNLWGAIAFVLYQPILLAPWHSLAAYAASFQPLPLLAWVIPYLLLAPVFLTMMTCLHAWTEGKKQLWSLLALVFAVVYTTLMSANYYIQIVVVQFNLVNGATDGLSLWLYAHPYPRSIPGALEGIAYGFMCISFLLAAQVFGSGRLEQWVRWSFVGTGLTGLVIFVDPLYRLPFVFLAIDGVVSGLLLVVAPMLLAVLLRRGTHWGVVATAA